MTDTSPLIEAQQRFAAAVPFRTLGAERCALSESLGRTLYCDLAAPEDSPPYHRVIVEGFVVNAADTREASESNPVLFSIIGEVKPGDSTCPAIAPGQALGVATGSIVSDGALSVVRMWEATRQGDSFTITRPFPPRFFIEDQGCDIKKGAVVLSAGTVLDPMNLGTVASLGIDTLDVARTPRVALFSSGDEVIPYTDPMHPGAIRDSNSVMLAAAIAQAGGVPVFGGIMSDDFDGFVAAATQALKDADMLVISGGTAVGGRDFISDLVRALGELLVDGVPMRSGRPLIMGVAQGKPIVCVAGHPPEALRGFNLFGVAAINKLLGRPADLPLDA
ncbi:MAG: molybdopterin molybdotransferase MoeA [Gammaproteobacteria bacterium]|nr:molybdopterin molybdotransferase MoeA [Gammaproteobacteria bacterium]